MKLAEERTQDPGLWDNPEYAAEITQKVSDLKSEINNWREIEEELNDLAELAAMVEEGQDPTFEKEIEEKLKAFKKKFAKKEITVFLSGRYDSGPALLSLYAGAGVTEAQDWASILLRMYSRYAERRGWDARILNEHQGQEAGLKNATLKISGRYAYGYLKRESGVHRLVRLSPFNANNLRHTSFTLVEVLPEISDNDEVEIKSEDLRVDTFRASGAGGQYVNKTDSAVRLTHLPTGLVVACQSERSQGSNKEQAMKMLRAKLYRLQQENRQKEINKLKDKIGSGEGTAEWGAQIRSYVLHPYKMVKDLRTGVESKQPDQVLDGELDEFIEAEIKT